MACRPCVFAPTWLESPSSHTEGELLDHVENCKSCMKYFDENESAFEKRLLNGSLLPVNSLLAKANQRINTVAPAQLPPQETDFLTPYAHGYVLKEPLRRNKTSQVFSAQQMNPEREVVVKFIHCHNSQFDYQLLIREGNTLGALKHPNIVTIHQTGKWADGIWLAMENCSGGSLANRLANGTQWDDRAIANKVCKIAQGVSAAHHGGIIHNDIKPSNILFTLENEPKLADFGLARHLKHDLFTKSGFKMQGTPAYMAPEQVQGGPPDVRTDIHGIGGILYQLLTGKPPFSAESEYHSILQAAHITPTPPIEINKKISPDLNAITMKCLAKGPDERYQSADNLIEDLHSLLSGKPVSARQLTSVGSFLLWTRNHKTAAILILSIFITLLGSSLALLVMAASVNSDRNRALKSEETALKLQEFSELQAYAAKIQTAYFELKSGTTRSATEHLATLPFNKRDWEHNLLTTELMQNHITLRRHIGQVTSLAISSDGNEIASGSSDRTIGLHHLKINERSLPDWDGTFMNHAVVYSKDNSKLAVLRADAKVFVFDAKNLALRTKIQLHLDHLNPTDRSANLITISADGSKIFAGNRQNRLECWDTATGQLVQEFEPFHTNKITAVRIAPDGKQLFSAGYDGKIAVWNMETSNIISQIFLADFPLHALAISPDGNTIASGGQGNKFYLHNTKTGKLIYSGDGHLDWINSIDFDPSGKVLATASDDHTIRLWDTATGRFLSTLKGHNDIVTCLNFSPDRRFLVSGSYDCSIKIWDLEKLRHKPVLNHSRAVTAITFHPKTGSLVWGDANGFVGMWDHTTDPKESSSILFREQQKITSISANPQNGSIVTQAIDGPVKVWGPNLTDSPKTLATPKSNGALAHSPDGAHLYIGGEDGNLYAWDTQTNSVAYQCTGHYAPIAIVATSLDGRLVAAGYSDGSVRIWQTRDGKFLKIFNEHRTKIKCLAISPDGRWLASSAGDKEIVLINLLNDEVEQLHEGHSMVVSGLAFHPNRPRLISSGFDRSIHVWDFTHQKKVLTLSEHHSEVNGITLSPNGTHLASCGQDGSIIVRSSLFKMDFFMARYDGETTEDMIWNRKIHHPDFQREFQGTPYFDNPRGLWSVKLETEMNFLVHKKIRLANLNKIDSPLAEWKQFIMPK